MLSDEERAESDAAVDEWGADLEVRTQPGRILFELVEQNKKLAAIHKDLRTLAAWIGALLFMILWKVW